ncbi:signal transduction histidine kinase [Spinactinospora alkalitolerans]|uniref:histidine kinase n=1 Tax=Spinactinospora alkalitolerans TaxID=687207 RepID=A0A852U0V8_9ACTN|nr:sensor histidine kinase [Spinactinospora alkalitolerans]NYE47640.1 signal transduction histidine kinase [Spinactinospora alkalitolerans]
MAAEDYRAGRLRLLGWSLSFAGLSLVGVVLLVLMLVAGVLTAVWIGLPLLLLAATLVRGLANAHRSMLGRWLDEPIPSPYLPRRHDGVTGRVRSLLTDPATWRDAAWLLFNATVGLTVVLLPAAFLANAVNDFLVPYYWRFIGDDAWFGLVHVTDQTDTYWTIPQGLASLLVFWLSAPPALRGYARMSRWLLAPTARSLLAARVAHLATSRADTVDAQASEVRRIERDLHDGAQARLVALGMSLGMAEEMLARDPEAAQRLLTEARESTRQALTELRDLVRGIHPPVLVERGLDGAVRALAVTQQMPIAVDIELPGRLPDPVESAAYFTVAELLTNAAKHSRAERAWVRINCGEDRLVMVIGDDGVGGASAEDGTGLKGIRRRLSAFDGALHVMSPAGGPTIITVSLPLAESVRASHRPA